MARRKADNDSEEEQVNFNQIFDNIKESLSKRQIHISKGDNPDLKLRLIPVGIPQYDNMLGGGYNRGGFHVITGESKAGKTTIALKAIAHSQSLGYNCAYIDAENRYDRVWFEKCGIQLNKLTYFRPKYAEQAVEVILALLENNFDLIVIDSLAGFVPKSEAKAKGSEAVEKQQIGILARVLDKAIKLFGTANENTVILALNQYRTNIVLDKFTRSTVLKDIMPGGRAQYYHAHTMVEMSHKKFIYDKPQGQPDRSVIGMEMRAVLLTALHTPPRVFCNIPLAYENASTDILENFVTVALERKVINRRGRFYDLSNVVEGKTDLISGLNAVIDFFKEHNDHYEVLKNKVAESGEKFSKETDEFIAETEEPIAE